MISPLSPADRDPSPGESRILGVVSDTHGHLEYTRQAIRVLENMQVEQVIHCGDIGSPEVVGQFSKWPTHFVFGNVDTDEAVLREAIQEAGQSCHGRFGALEWGGCKIAFLHSDDLRQFHKTVTSGEWDLVCYGHTHVAKLEKIGPTWVLNPGALYRAHPHSLAIVELPSLKVTHIDV